MDEQRTDNDVFRIRPPSFEQDAKDSDWFSWMPVNRVRYDVYFSSSFGWKWRYNGSAWSAKTKEDAMAECERHWIREIEPSLVRVDDGRDALLERALDALREIHGAGLQGASATPRIVSALTVVYRVASEIEQAISAKEASV